MIFTDVHTDRQKLDVILGIKVVQFWSYQKMYFTKNVVLNWYSSMKKKIRKIRMIFDIENWLWRSDLDTYWQPRTTDAQFAKADCCTTDNCILTVYTEEKSICTSNFWDLLVNPERSFKILSHMHQILDAFHKIEVWVSEWLHFHDSGP